MADYQPPHSKEAEESLLGCLIIDPSLRIGLDDLSPDDFYYNKNGAVFKAFEELHNENSAIDFTTLSNKLEKHGVLNLIGGMDYITYLATQAPMAPNVKEYTKIIKDSSLSRKLIDTTKEITKSAYQNKEDIEDLLTEAESLIFNLGSKQDRNDMAPISSIILSTLEKIHQISENKGKLTGISTGFVELDQMTSGLQNSDLIILAARPSMGKTALALNICTHAALREKKNVVIFSLEMSREQLAQRMILSEACVDGNDVRNGLISTEQWKALMAASETLANSSIVINDTPGIAVSEVQSICRRMQLERPIDLIVIDYMQLMTSKARSENRQNEISEISRSLKALAREMQCPVICLSQLARGPEARTDKRPMLSDLRDSGSIEQDADMVMFLYRDAYYNPDGQVSPYEAELKLAKHRNGPTGTVKLSWIAKFTKFTNYSNQTDEVSSA